MSLMNYTGKTLRELVADARSKGIAIGHFNISNLEGLHGTFNAAKELNVPVIIGVSEGEREFVGVHEAAALVKELRETHNFPIFLNADHTYSFEKVKEAIDAGFDAVIFDGAKGEMDDNIRETKRCVEYARGVGRDVLVEAELGFIGQSSRINDAVPEGVEVTTVEDAVKFVTGTGIDLFAPAVGNIHGLLRDGPKPPLQPQRVREISEATGLPLVLHGASGYETDVVRACIKAGVAIVHVNTEIRVAFHDAVKDALTAHPDEVAPYKLMKPAVDAIQAVVKEKLQMFNFL